MATSVFDKNGKEFKVTHKIDVKDWLDGGYTLEDPKAEVKAKAEEKPKADAEAKAKADTNKK